MITSESPDERRRLLAVLYQFLPYRAVGAQSSAQVCRHLPEQGWDVTVLTVREDYFAPSEREASPPFPGSIIRTRVMRHPIAVYQRLRKSRAEQKGNAYGEQQAERSNLRRSLVALLQVPDLCTGWLPPAIWNGIRAIRRERVQCLFSSGPWWTNHLVALSLARLTGLPWVAHFRDSWAQGQWVKPVTPLSIRIEKMLERSVVKRADRIVCVTDRQAAMLSNANRDLPQQKFVTIPNGYDEAEWANVDARAREQKQFVITYAGNLYHGRSPYPLFRALQALVENGRLGRDEIRLELLGFCDVAEGLPVREVAARCGLADCVATPGLVEKREALARMMRSDLLLLLIDEQSYSIPAKTYEYLRAGRPILALTTGGAVVDLLQQTGGAWIADPTDIEAIKVAVMDAVSAWRRGRDARSPRHDVVIQYDRRRLARDLADVFDAITDASIKHRQFARTNGRPTSPVHDDPCAAPSPGRMSLPE